MSAIKIAAFSGSLRKKSYTTALVHHFQKLAPADVNFEFIDISMLPFINQDLEQDLPKAVIDLHYSIAETDAVLLASPEYNRSYSPVLKNALDWGSRPAGKNKWDKKPVALIGCSPHALGGFGAINHLRQVVMYLNMPVLQQPEFYLSKAGDKINEQGELHDEETEKLIHKFWFEFVEWIKVNNHSTSEVAGVLHQ
jgi:chromate reductase